MVKICERAFPPSVVNFFWYNRLSCLSHSMNCAYFNFTLVEILFMLPRQLFNEKWQLFSLKKVVPNFWQNREIPLQFPLLLKEKWPRSPLCYAPQYAKFKPLVYKICPCPWNWTPLLCPLHEDTQPLFFMADMLVQKFTRPDFCPFLAQKSVFLCFVCLSRGGFQNLKSQPS